MTASPMFSYRKVFSALLVPTVSVSTFLVVTNTARSAEGWVMSHVSNGGHRTLPTTTRRKRNHLQGLVSSSALKSSWTNDGNHGFSNCTAGTSNMLQEDDHSSSPYQFQSRSTTPPWSRQSTPSTGEATAKNRPLPLIVKRMNNNKNMRYSPTASQTLHSNGFQQGATTSSRTKSFDSSTDDYLDYQYDYGAIMQSYLAQRQERKFRVYCDLDGVLVDFCRGIQELYPNDEWKLHSSSSSSSLSKPTLPQPLCGMPSFSVDDLHRPSMWERVAQANSFFEHLPWLQSGRTLWEVVQELEPSILTGVPKFPTASRYQKVEWCKRELGIPIIAHTDMAGHGFQHFPVLPPSQSNLWISPSSMRMDPHAGRTPLLHNSHQDDHLPKKNKSFCHVITCWSNNKHYESGPGAVLIDDRIDLKKSWEDKGGIFIHHKPHDVEDTIYQLDRRGILDEYSYRHRTFTPRMEQQAQQRQNQYQ